MTLEGNNWWKAFAVVMVIAMIGTAHLLMNHDRIVRAETIDAVPVRPADPIRQAQLLSVAGVLGQFPECRAQFPRIVYQVVDAARGAGFDPQLLASVVVVESRCDALAVSYKGAIGAVQIVPRVWASDFDFRNRYNLFNFEDNLTVGAQILESEIKRYGLRQGLEHYQGTGAGRDGTYVERILKLAGR